MVRRFLPVFIAIVCILHPLALSAPQRKLIVVATIPPLASIAKEVGGDLVEVYYLVPPGSDPHQYAMTPKDLELVRLCDLFIAVGREGFLGALPENPGRIKLSWESWLSSGVYIKDGNPHYLWLYPPNAAKVAERIYEALVRLDPKDRDYYYERLMLFKKKMEELDKWARNTVKAYGVEGARVALVGKHFEPLIEWLGMKIVGVLLPTGGAVASPRGLAEFEEEIKRKEAEVIVVLATQRYGDEGRLGEAVSRDTGVPVVYLYGIPLDPSDTYTEFIKYNTAALISSIVSGSGRGVEGINPLMAWSAFGILTAIAVIEALIIKTGWSPRSR